MSAEAGNVSNLYRKNYNKEMALSRMKSIGASAGDDMVKRMLANARAIDEGHYKDMLKAYNDATDPLKGRKMPLMVHSRFGR
jgi:hypothetical protein